MFKSFFIRSSTLSGAEKRALKINYALNKGGEKYFFLLNRKLYNLIENSEYKKFIINALVYDDFTFIEKVLLKIPFSNSWKTKLQFFKINYLIKRNNINLVHIFLSMDGGKFIKCRKVFEITSPDYVSKIGSENSSFIDGIDLFNAVSESTFQNASKFIPENKLVLAPIPFFFPNVSTDLLNQYNYENKENAILFAHRLIERKNGLLFANVVKDFLKTNQDWKIKFFGDGPEKESIRELLEEEIKNGFVSVDYTSDILPEMAKSKIFVSLISPDNYPSQSVLESMFMENALLISDTGFTKKMFFESNGLVCSLEKTDILNKLGQLVSEDLYSMGKNSRNLLDTKFSKSQYLNHIKKIHDSVLGS